LFHCCRCIMHDGLSLRDVGIVLHNAQKPIQKW
jgi:hypothetical protein